jgi:hypothetical protein
MKIDMTEQATIILGRMMEVFAISVKITHFGKKPVRGGRPLIDNRLRFIIIFILRGMLIIWLR